MSLWILLFLLCTKLTCFDAARNSVLRIESNLENESDLENLKYGVDDGNILPLLSRDVTLLERAIDAIEDGTCRDQCRLMLSGLHNLTTWAVKFYDSSGKFPEGVLGGSIYQIGNFDECLEIGETPEVHEPVGIRGQYCLGEVGIKVPLNYVERRGSIWESFRIADERYEESITKLYWGICVPAACSNRDVEGVINRVLDVAFSGSRLSLDFNIPDSQCYKDEPFSTDTLDVVYM